MFGSRLKYDSFLEFEGLSGAANMWNFVELKFSIKEKVVNMHNETVM